MELSAMLVAKMTFLFPSSGLRNTLDCSSDDMEEWRSKTLKLKREGEEREREREREEGERERERGREGGREGERESNTLGDEAITYTYPRFL